MTLESIAMSRSATAATAGRNPEDELSKYLAEGWLARMAGNGSKFVVERPG